jgi:hypothetical protein
MFGVGGLGFGFGFRGSSPGSIETPQDLAASFNLTSDASAELTVTPLGNAFWSLYVDARDYASSLANNAVLSSAIAPRVGPNITPQNSPTYKSAGIGQRGSFAQVAASAQGFAANSLASLMTGGDKPATIAIRIQRGDAAAQTVFGWGSSSATQDFFEIALSAGGVPILRKDANLETTKSYTGSTNLQFVQHDLIVTTDGSVATLYVDGVAEGTITGVDLNTLDVAVTQLSIGNDARSTFGTNGLGGSWQACAVSTNVASAAEVAAIHANWIAEDITSTGTGRVYGVGDSHMKASGLRKGIVDYAIANTLTQIDMVGTFQDGTFADNQHSGVNGVEIASIQSRAVGELGTGSAFPSVKLVLIIGGVNDLNNIGANVTTIETAFSNMVTAIHNAATASVGTARIAIWGVPPLQPGSQGDTLVTTFNAWLRGTFVSTWNAAHPSNQVFWIDTELAIGGAWRPDYYLDSAHMNDTGWSQVKAHATYGTDVVLGSYLTSIG